MEQDELDDDDEDYEEKPRKLKKPRKKKKLRSKIWYYFDSVDEGVSQCKECNKKIITNKNSKGSTSGLINHLRHAHPHLFDAFQAIKKESGLGMKEEFGQIAAVLVTDGESYQSIDADGNFASGPVAQDLLWRIARVALQPEDAVDLLLGVPIPSDDASFAGGFIDTRGTLSIDFRDENGVLSDRFGFNEAGQLSEFVRFEDDGKIAWEATFSDYREVSGSLFAFEVDLKFPEVHAAASLQFDHASLGPVLADELFVLRPRTSAVNQ